jgi:hypothetical protein
MSSRSISANLKFEVVQRIMAFQDTHKIRHFADAVEAYIEHLENNAYPVVSRLTEMNSWQRP